METGTFCCPLQLTKYHKPDHPEQAQSDRQQGFFNRAQETNTAAVRPWVDVVNYVAELL